MKIFNFTFLDKLSAEQHEKLDNLYYYSSKSIQTKDLFAEINNSLKLLKQRINTNLRTKFSNSDEEEQNEMEPKFKRNVVVPNSDRQNNIVVKLSEGFNNYLQNNKAKEILMSYKQSLWYYSGESILREICMLEAQRDIDKWIIRIVAIVRVLLILGIQFRTPGLVTTINAGDWILYVLLILVSLKIHTINISFILTGVSDFKRKLFYMRMMSSLIDPDK